LRVPIQLMNGIWNLLKYEKCVKISSLWNENGTQNLPNRREEFCLDTPSSVRHIIKIFIFSLTQHLILRALFATCQNSFPIFPLNPLRTYFLFWSCMC